MEESFLKVSSTGIDYFVNIKYDENKDQIIIISAVDGQNAWCGEVSKKELEDQASSTEMKIDEFLQDTKCALSLAHDPTKKKFSQSIESEKNYLKFSWKLVLDDEIKFCLGYVYLRKDEARNINSFLDAAVLQFSSMKGEISALSSAKKNWKEEREKMLMTLEECTLAKERLEEDLYGKFVLVLNAKKAKIRELKQQCEDMKTGTVEEAMDEDDWKTNESRSSDSTEDDEATDKEEEMLREKRAKCQAGKREMPKIAGLDAADDDALPIAPRRKREKKQRGSGRTSVLPRVPSLSRPQRKGKLTKSERSPTLNQSSENLEKLLDHM